MSSEIATVLVATLSPDTNTRVSAELRLNELFKAPDTGVSLAAILVAQDADESLRQMSLDMDIFPVAMKYVQEHWSDTFPQFKGPFPPPEAKDRIRALVFSGLSDSHRKIRTSSAFVLSFITKADWPEDYPSLLNDLLLLISSGNNASIHGAMQVLTEFIRSELSEDQVLPILRQLLPLLLTILGSTEHSPLTRARAIAVFRQCITALDMVRKEHPEAVNEAINGVLPQWLDAFRILLEQDALSDLKDPSWEPLAIRSQVFKTLGIIQTNFSAALAPVAEGFIGLAITNLTALMPAFRQHCILPDSPPPPAFSQDDPDIVLSLGNLACPAMDFVGDFVRKRKNSTWAQTNIATLLNLALYWMQITTEEEEAWQEDANAFVREENEPGEAYSARVAGLDLVGDLLENFPEDAAAYIWNTLKGTVGGSMAAKQAGQVDWWQPLEACLAAINNEEVADILETARDFGKPAPIDLEALLANLLPPILTEHGTPFLQGRAFMTASSLARLLPSALIGNYLSAAVEVLESPNASAPLKVAAIKAIRNFCSVDEDRPLAKFGPRVVAALAPFMGSATEDSLGVVLEALSTVIQVDTGRWLTPELATTVVGMMLASYEKNINDPMSLSIITDIFTFIASAESRGVYQAAVLATVPILGPTIANNDGWICCSALQILTALFDGAKVGQLGDGVVAALAPHLFAALNKISDPEAISEGSRLITSIIRKDSAQFFSFTDSDGLTSLQKTGNFIFRLLSPDVEEAAGLATGDLLVTLFRHAGDALGGMMQPILDAMIKRLATAKTATGAQSLIIPFAFLIHNNLAVVLDFLEGVQVNVEGSAPQSGLQVLLSAWCENAETFIGNWASRISHVALGQLFLTERSSLQQTFVRGDLIITPETSNRIVTRSRSKQTPHEYTQIPFPLKALKIIIHRLHSDGEAAALASKPDYDDASSEGGDDEAWEDEEKITEAVLLSEALRLDADDQPGSGLDDSEFENDDVMRMNITENTISFIRECAARNVNQFAALRDQLKVEEMIVVDQSLAGA